MDWTRTDFDRREDLFGGQGVVRVWNLLGSVALAPFSAVLACELAPGGRVGAHVQAHDPEIIIAVEGEAVLYVQGKAQAATPGVVVALPLGQQLEIDNASLEKPFRYLIIKASR